MLKWILRITFCAVFYTLIISPAFAQTAFDLNDPNFVGPKPYRGPRIEVNVAARLLNVYLEDGSESHWVMSYPVAVGSRMHRTPLGEREMGDIIWNPSWFPPKSDWAKDSEITPPGPGNPLGPVKMDLGGAILIHGTNKPSSIGKAASHGCMRMKSADAKALAWYLQQQVVLESTDAEFDKYQKFNRRSFYVKLPTPIPVNVVYNLFEVRDQSLYVYQDVYGYFKNKDQVLEELTQTLTAHGLDVANYDLEMLQNQIQGSKNKDFFVSLNDLSRPDLLHTEQAQNQVEIPNSGIEKQSLVKNMLQ